MTVYKTRLGGERVFFEGFFSVCVNLFLLCFFSTPPLGPSSTYPLLGRGDHRTAQVEVLPRSEGEPSRLAEAKLQDRARREKFCRQHGRGPRQPPRPDDPLQGVDRQRRQQQQEHLVRLLQQEVPGPFFGEQHRRRDVDAVSDQHHREGDDEQVVRDPEVGEGVQGGAQSRPSEASGALWPARRERVRDEDEQDQDPARDKGPRRGDVSERQGPRRPQPDLLLAGPPRPDDRPRGHEHAVERPGGGSCEGEPDVVLDDAVEVKVVAEGRRSELQFFLERMQRKRGRERQENEVE